MQWYLDAHLHQSITTNKRINDNLLNRPKKELRKMAKASTQFRKENQKGEMQRTRLSEIFLFILARASAICQTSTMPNTAVIDQPA